MRDLLITEYESLLSSVAARFGADGGARLGDDGGAHWSSPLGGVTVGISLAMAGPRDDRYFVPECRTGTTRGLPRDAATALVVIEDTRATLLRVLTALLALDSPRVWMDGAPCGECSARGTTRGSVCKRCNGVGKRMIAVEILKTGDAR